MANLQFKGFYTTQDIVSFVVAGAADTPGVTASNPIFDATVDWGSGGQQNIRYTASSGNGIVISDKKVNLIHTDNTNSSSPEIKYYSTTGNKTVSITGGWKNALNDTDSYLALPKQSVSRYGSNVFLNNKKGDLSMSTDQSDLVFKFGGDYIGLRSSDGIKLVKGEKYSIPSNDFNFRLESNSHLDAVYSDGELDTKTESGFLQYFYDIDGVTYSSEFEIVDSIDTTIAPALSEWDGMLTQRYSVDDSAYDIFTFNGNSIDPMNKRKAFRIDLGANFQFHGVGDFASYSVRRIENMTGHTQSFSGAADHMFAGCTRLKFSSVISNMNLNGITSMLGFMSGCSSYVQFFMLNSATSGALTDLTGCFEYSSYKPGKLKNWDVSQVTSLESFLEGTAFNKAGITEKWDTSSVTNFKNMFKNNADYDQFLGGIDVSSAQNMEGMFHNSKKLKSGLNGWNVSNVVSFKNMFRGASSFNKSLSKWKTGSATTMKGMFCNASSFDQAVWAKPGTGRWDTSNVESFESMFEGSSLSKSTNSWNIRKAKSFKNMFKSATAFNKPLPKWAGDFGASLAESEKNIDFTGMFESSIYNQSVKDWDVSNAISIKNMFKDNTEFNSELFSGTKFQSTKCENVTNFLCGTTALHTAINSPLTPDSIKNPLTTYGDTVKDSIGFALMFCTDDSSIPNELKSNTYKTYRSAWESENSFVVVEEPPEPLPSENSYAFANRDELDTAIDAWMSNQTSAEETYGEIGTWDVSAITDMRSLFHGKSSSDVRELDLSNWDVSNVTKMGEMFKTCRYFSSINLSGWDVSSCDSFYALFDIGHNTTALLTRNSMKATLKSIDLSNWTFSSSLLLYVNYMFWGLSNLETLDISGWTNFKPLALSHMFYEVGKDSESKPSIDLTNWDMSNVESFGYMFFRANFASVGDLSGWDLTGTLEGSWVFGLMFYDYQGASPGDLSEWCVSHIADTNQFSKWSNIPSSNLPNWGAAC